MKAYESLKDTLSFYSVNCNKPCYISTATLIFKFPEKPFRIYFYALGICASGPIQVETDNQKYDINKHDTSQEANNLSWAEQSGKFREWIGVIF